METALNGVGEEGTELTHVHDAHQHDAVIFPSATNLDCVLTAHADANTWNNWTEIADTTGTPITLSSKFASYAGHITGMIVEECNQASTVYMVELSWGASNTIISRFRFISETNNLPVFGIARIRGEEIPAGETIYYRAMCETAAAKTLNVHFRYFLHD